MSKAQERTCGRVDLVPAVFLGGSISAAIMLPLALLGVFQLGLPCMLMVIAARHLSAPEISLLALLEVVLGPLWAWLGAGEVLASGTVLGGLLVLGALVANELASLRAR